MCNNGRKKTSFARHLILSIFLLFFIGNALAQTEGPPLYQPSSATVNYPAYYHYHGTYISEEAAVGQCTEFLTGTPCFAVIKDGVPVEVFAYTYFSSFFVSPGDKIGPGFLDCNTTASWISDCAAHLWVIAEDGTCDAGYAPDEDGKCALECEDIEGSEAIRDKHGICGLIEPETPEFPEELLQGMMDGIANYCAVISQINTLLGNPINYLTGNKVEYAIDSVISGDKPFKISRTYNSNTGSWTFSVARSVKITYDDAIQNQFSTAAITMADGRKVIFDYELTESKFVPRNIGDGTFDVIVFQNAPISMNYRKLNGQQETYNQNGKLIGITFPNGTFWTMQVADYGWLAEDSRGKNFQIHLNEAGLVSKIMRDGVDVVTYEYNASGMLQSVKNSDDTEVQYLYEDSLRPYLLTGRIGENGHRTSTWEYNSDGLATETFHHTSNGDVIAHYELDYVSENGGDTGSVTAINPLGKSTTYHYVTIAGLRKVVNIEGHATEFCLAANKQYEYYDNGLLESSFDWDGVETYYEYNDRGLKEKVIKARGTDAEVEVNYVWHDTLALPTEIIETKRVTEFSYDLFGNVLTKTIKSR